MTKPAGRGLILVSPDKFRGTLTASEAAAAMQAGVHTTRGEAVIGSLSRTCHGGMPIPGESDGDA